MGASDGYDACTTVPALSAHSVASETANAADMNEAMQRLGMNQWAYTRRARHQGQLMWSIHTPDGIPVAVTPTRRQAVAAILQNDLIPLSVH